jgi:hypothetical protein
MLVPFQSPKKSRFLGPTPPKMPLVMDSPPSKPRRTGTAPYKQQIHLFKDDVPVVWFDVRLRYGTYFQCRGTVNIYYGSGSGPRV